MPDHPRLRRPRPVLAVALAFAGVAMACEPIEEVAQRWVPTTPHEAYLAGLEAAGLSETELGRRWRDEAERAIASPAGVSLPLREERFIAPEAPEAFGYRFRLERGRRLTVRVATDSPTGARVFLDVFRIAADSAGPPRPLLTADTLPDGLSYEPYRAGDYLVRVQPELLHAGTVRIELEVDPALAFPVEGRSTGAVLSFFGAERDGGRRSHHGVDIFAPRGTPVLASVAGRVNRVDVTNLGGKVVWVRDERHDRNLYYAHLDSQTVANGDVVEPGDTVGFVGNTGNARTTPPHLHYGIYYRGEGPVDPMPFLREPVRRAPELVADRSALGGWATVGDDGVRLRSAPSLRADVSAELTTDQTFRVIGANGDFFLVRLGDGRTGYVLARLAGVLDAPSTPDRSGADAVAAPADDVQFPGN